MDFSSARASDYTVFQEEFGDVAWQADIENYLRRQLPSDNQKVDYLVKVHPGEYDQKAAALLSIASTWAYSDADTMARMMRNGGIPNNQCVSIHLKNNALFLDTTAHVIQSKRGRLAILAFGGTDPTNAIHLLSDLSAKTDPFYSRGSVHGGFFRAFQALWRSVQLMLIGTTLQYSVCDMAAAESMFHRCHFSLDPHAEKKAKQRQGIGTEGREPLAAFYITGHSLGGALAVLAAAAIHADPSLAEIKDKLRGVYTFGQPMVGDDVFTDWCRNEFGDQVFRHVYRRDVMPKLPPWTMGRFHHFGSLYTTSLLSGGWHQTRVVEGPFEELDRAAAGSLALTIGLLAWVRDQFPVLSRLPLPYSLADHSPDNYLRTSLESVPGTEF